MKALAEQVFKGEITDLSLEEMELICLGLHLIYEGPLKTARMPNKKLAEDMAADIGTKLRQANWRE